jgi:hypothetical protein
MTAYASSDCEIEDVFQRGPQAAQGMETGSGAYRCPQHLRAMLHSAAL